MGLSCVQVLKNSGKQVKGLVTASLQSNFCGVARKGQWLVVDTDYTQCGRSLCFTRAAVLADSEVVATCMATFKLVSGPVPD